MKKIKEVLEKISIIDVVIVFALILAIISIFTKYSQIDNATNLIEYNSFEYDILFEYVRPTTGEMLQVGDKIFDKVSGTNIGEITAVVSNNAKKQFEMLDGTITKKEVDSKADIVITVKTNGSIKNNEYMANNLIRILVGKTIETKTKYVDVTGCILDVRKI